MAAQASGVLKRALRRGATWLGWAGAALFLVVVVFLLTSWIGSSIPRNGKWVEPEPGTPGSVEIMVETNGVHTALVLPLVTPERDWRTVLPKADVRQPNRPYTHVSVSWGEKQVFLETETWGDLKPSTVLRIVGIGGDGLLHIAYYVRPAPGENIRPLRLTREQYRRLVSAIDRALPNGEWQRHDGYGDFDVFYDAPGHYTVRNTCNQWTSNTLASAGVETGWWTPFAGGVMKWVAKPGETKVSR